MNSRFAFTGARRSVFCIGIIFAVLAIGVAMGRAQAQPSTDISSTNKQSNSNMKQFVIIFRQGPRKLTETELAQRQKEVFAWAREQNAAGHKLEPRILGPEVLRPGSEADSGIGNGAWPITALLFLEADNLASAAKVAASHPANHFGGSVEVRPWAPPAVVAAPAR